MRRTIFMALLAALLLVPGVAHAQGPIQIIRDCEDDGVLQGDYTASELRNARSELPTDIDEYSDCRDVLSRAIANASGSSTGGGWEPNHTPNSATGGGGGGGGSATGSAATAQPTGTPAAPHTAEEDKVLLAQAAESGDRGDVIDGKPVSPGASRLAADVGRNALPPTTLAVLGLFVIALLTACLLPLIRRRRGDTRSST